MGVEIEPGWAARDSTLDDGPAEPDESVSVRIAALGRLCPVQEAAPAVFFRPWRGRRGRGQPTLERSDRSGRLSKPPGGPPYFTARLAVVNLGQCQFQVFYNQIDPAVVVVTLPVGLVVLLAKRRIISGLTAGAVK